MYVIIEIWFVVILDWNNANREIELTTAQSVAFEELQSCLDSGKSNGSEQSFYQETIDILLFSILILLATNSNNSNVKAIANQFNCYVDWMSKPKDLFKVEINQSTFQN